MKVINLENQEDSIEDIRKEIAFLSNCDCEYVTKYHCSYLFGMKLHIIMDYCGLGSIRQLLRVGPIPEKYIPFIVRDVILALEYLHKNGIVHRDIKGFLQFYFISSKYFND